MLSDPGLLTFRLLFEGKASLVSTLRLNLSFSFCGKIMYLKDRRFFVGCVLGAFSFFFPLRKDAQAPIPSVSLVRSAKYPGSWVEHPGGKSPLPYGMALSAPQARERCPCGALCTPQTSPEKPRGSFWAKSPLAVLGTAARTAGTARPRVQGAVHPLDHLCASKTV